MKKILFSISSLAALLVLLGSSAGYCVYQDYSCVQRCYGDAQKRTTACGMDRRCAAGVQQWLNRCVSDCDKNKAR